jgi:RNA polymerase sigma factor (sigma-70 family)
MVNELKPRGDASADHLTDGELLNACTQGQAWAWETLVERHKRLVWSVSLKCGLCQEDAADVFQSVFAALFEYKDTIRDGNGLAKWLITTTRRESWAVSKKRTHEPFVQDMGIEYGLSTDPDANPASSLYASVEREILKQGLGYLGERCRMLLWLLYFDEREPSYEEISSELDMPIGSIGPTRARCLQKLRDILQEMGF